MAGAIRVFRGSPGHVGSARQIAGLVAGYVSGLGVAGDGRHAVTIIRRKGDVQGGDF
jgi:hypothetical protein